MLSHPSILALPNANSALTFPSAGSHPSGRPRAERCTSVASSCYEGGEGGRPKSACQQPPTSVLSTSQTAAGSASHAPRARSALDNDKLALVDVERDIVEEGGSCSFVPAESYTRVGACAQPQANELGPCTHLENVLLRFLTESRGAGMSGAG